MVTLILEEIDGSLCGRIYLSGVKTTAYVVPQEDNKFLFTEEQLQRIDSQMF